jgi:hypothetical protein
LHIREALDELAEIDPVTESERHVVGEAPKPSVEI